MVNDGDDCLLPDDLMADVAQGGARRITLVIGAGCSFEQPTDLPLSDQLSRQVHRSLCADGVLDDPCENPSDLSEVADAVHDQRGTIAPLVDRMKPQRFINVKPNRGHLIAAALMRERIVGCLITLNYDDAMTQAIGWVGGNEDIADIRGYELHRDLRDVNLVYLHGRADASNPDRLIMRTEQLEEEWRDGWEEAIVRAELIRPSCVFVGLGTPAGVLVESTQRLKSAVGDESNYYQVDPSDYDDSAEGEGSSFREALDINEANYIQASWCEFMDIVGNRYQVEQINELSDACVDLALNGLSDLFDDVDEPEDYVRGRLRSLLGYGEEDAYDVLELGELRARWFLEEGHDYYPHARDHVPTWLGQLLVGIDYIARRYDICEVTFYPGNGEAELIGEDGRTWVAQLVHGRSTKSWSQVATATSSGGRRGRRRRGAAVSTLILSEGVLGHASDISTPSDIADLGVESENRRPRLINWDPPDTLVEVSRIENQLDDLDEHFS